jgi:hypothetical protein
MPKKDEGDMNPTSTILFGLIFIAIGFLIGAAYFNARSRTAGGAGEANPAIPARRGEARLWRDPLSQRLLVEMDGEIFRNPGAMSGEQRARLANLVKDTDGWLPLLPRSAVPKLHADPGAAGQGAVPAEKAALLSEPGKARAGSAPQSIAAQIDEILQEKLAGTALAERGIKLLELPDQGLVVMVGMDKYTDLTLVPDEQVRAVIGEAVAAWEDRSSSKRD